MERQELGVLDLEPVRNLAGRLRKADTFEQNDVTHFMGNHIEVLPHLALLIGETNLPGRNVLMAGIVVADLDIAVSGSRPGGYGARHQLQSGSQADLFPFVQQILHGVVPGIDFGQSAFPKDAVPKIENKPGGGVDRSCGKGGIIWSQMIEMAISRPRAAAAYPTIPRPAPVRLIVWGLGPITRLVFSVQDVEEIIGGTVLDLHIGFNDKGHRLFETPDIGRLQEDPES